MEWVGVYLLRIPTLGHLLNRMFRARDSHKPTLIGYFPDCLAIVKSKDLTLFAARVEANQVETWARH